MFYYPAAFWMMQMPIMQIVDVISVLNRCVTTIWTMRMGVAAMLFISHRGLLLHQIIRHCYSLQYMLR